MLNLDAIRQTLQHKKQKRSQKCNIWRIKEKDSESAQSLIYNDL